MHPPLSLGLSEVGWVGEGKRNGNRTSAEQREVGRVKGGWWLCPARCQRGGGEEKKTERTAGEEKGEVVPGRWTQWPAGMGTGRGRVERGGVGTGEDDVENFI